MTAIDFETSESPKTVNNVTWTYANSVWTPSTQAGLIPIYSSVSAVNAISNPVDGQQALALISGDTSNAYYYIYKSGWFRAGVANLNPTISSDLNAAYLLGAGDTLTLSISATDPEGVPLTYSLTNNLGNVGTVDQTNLQNGSVVVTASSNEAHAGSGSIQFHISDGTNTANSQLAILTLNFLSIHWKHVALSTKTGSTNNGSNTTFTDLSSTSRSVTKTSNPYQGSFNPYGDCFSMKFDGSDDRLVTPSIGLTGQFTAEGWFYTDGSGWIFQSQDSAASSGNNGMRIALASNGYIAPQVYIGGSFSASGAINSGGSTDLRNQWNHFAITRNSSNLITVWVNGQSVVSSTTSVDFSGPFVIGASLDGGSYNTYFAGHISNFRVKTTCEYTSAFNSTSTITAPEAFTNNANTSLLLASNRFISPNPIPFASTQSIYFDGTNTNRITTAVHSDFHSTTNTNLTIEGWYYFNSFTESGQFFDFRTSSNHSAPFLWIDDSVGGGGTNKLRGYNWQGSTAIYSTNALFLNTWYHMAFVKAGTTGKVYLNGVEEISWSDTTGLAGEGFVTVGARYTVVGSGSSYYAMHGYVSNFRVSKNIRYANAAAALAYYNSPSAFTSDSNTNLLINDAIKDSSSNSHAITNVGVSPTFPITINSKPQIQKFSPFPDIIYDPASYYGSIFFDGSDDYLTISNVDLSGVFTISFWMYQSGTGYRVLQVGDEYISGENNAIKVDCYHTGVVSVRVHEGGNYVWEKGVNASTGKKFGLPQWAYVHMSRDSSNVFRFAVNGEEFDRYSGYTGAISADFTNNIRVANQKVNNTLQTSGEWHGYISDLRVTNTYIASATPPTSPVGTSNTKLYLPGNGAQIYDQSGHANLSLNGNVVNSSTQQKFSENSMKFDGSGDWILSGVLPKTQEFTMEAWVYVTTSNWDTNSLVLGSIGNAQAVGGMMAYTYVWNGVTYFRWYWGTGGGTSANFIVSSPPALNTWHHVAWVYSKSDSGTVRIFINGSNLTSMYGSEVQTGKDFEIYGDIYIGYNNFTSGNHTHTGYINNFQIFPYAKYASNFTVPAASFTRVIQ